MTSKVTSPIEVFNQLHQFVKKYDADGQADMFAKHGIWEFPFATGNFPKKIIGRENIRTFGKMAMENSKKAGRRIVDYRSLYFHQTQSSNTIIVEFELEGEIPSQDKKYRIPYLQILTTENGEIISLRDYFFMEVIKAVREELNKNDILDISFSNIFTILSI